MDRHSCSQVKKSGIARGYDDTCWRSATVQRDGKWYCTRHDPFKPPKEKPCCAKTAAIYQEKIRGILGIIESYPALTSEIDSNAQIQKTCRRLKDSIKAKYLGEN